MSDTELIHVLLVADRDPVSEWVVSTLRSEAGVVMAGMVRSLGRAISMIEPRHIDVLLLDPAVPDAKQVEQRRALTAMPTGPATLLLIGPNEIAFVQDAMLAGARGFLVKPFTQDQLMEGIHQAYKLLVQQRRSMSAASAATIARPATSEILVLFSPKGGVGRTSLATNLAVALHQEHDKPVTLVDGDLQFGDVDIAVNMVARKSIADLLAYVNELEPSLVESVLIAHPSGIKVLLAPPHFDPALESDEGRLTHAIKTLAAMHGGYVVVDAPAGLSESTLSLLDVAHRVLLVTAASVASLRATKRFLELAGKLNFPENKIVLVLSGYRKEDVSVEAIERHLAYPVAVTVPSDPLAMALALNQGEPLVVRERNHPISKAVFKLARYLGPGSPADAATAPAPSQLLPSPDSPTRFIPSMLLKPRQELGS